MHNRFSLLLKSVMYIEMSQKQFFIYIFQFNVRLIIFYYSLLDVMKPNS